MEKAQQWDTRVCHYTSLKDWGNLEDHKNIKDNA